MYKFIALLAIASAHRRYHHHEDEEQLGLYGENLWGYHQKVALRKAAAFFRYADTNNTGALTWSEYWTAVYKILNAKGYTHTVIMRYKKYFYSFTEELLAGAIYDILQV